MRDSSEVEEVVVAFVAQAPARAIVITGGAEAADYSAAVAAAASMTICMFDPLPGAMTSG